MKVQEYCVDNDDEPPVLEDLRDLKIAIAPTREETTHGMNNPGDEVANNMIEDDDTTLMDTMVAVALKAKAVKAKNLSLKMKQESKTTFGGGLKKGFFSSSKSTKDGKASALSQTNETAREDKKDIIPTIRATKQNGNKQSLQLDEVQHAMKTQIPLLDTKDWMTPEFMEMVMKNPKLCEALSNPDFNEALEDLKTDPMMAMKKHKNNPYVLRMMQEFMGLLGSHFGKLGEKQQVKEKQMTEEEIQKNALKSVTPRNDDEAKQLDRIMNDEELRQLLSDPELHRILQECNNPQALKRYTQDPIIAPKLKKLFDAGLIQLQ